MLTKNISDLESSGKLSFEHELYMTFVGQFDFMSVVI